MAASGKATLVLSYPSPAVPYVEALSKPKQVCPEQGKLFLALSKA